VNLDIGGPWWGAEDVVTLCHHNCPTKTRIAKRGSTDERRLNCNRTEHCPIIALDTLILFFDYRERRFLEEGDSVESVWGEMLGRVLVFADDVEGVYDAGKVL
jgi:hypothetical protein